MPAGLEVSSWGLGSAHRCVSMRAEWSPRSAHWQPRTLWSLRHRPRVALIGGERSDDSTRFTMADGPRPNRQTGKEGTGKMASRGRKLTGEVREHSTRSGIITYSIRVR